MTKAWRHDEIQRAAEDAAQRGKEPTMKIRDLNPVTVCVGAYLAFCAVRLIDVLIQWGMKYGSPGVGKIHEAAINDLGWAVLLLIAWVWVRSRLGKTGGNG